MAQDAGKGRQGRTWVSAEGNFFGSTLVKIGPEDPPAATLSLAAGLALIEAVDVAVTGVPLLLKWPNDLILGGKKLAGILLERSGERVAAGFGVNLASAPVLPDREAARLGGQLTVPSFAPLLAASFSRLVDLWRSSDPGLIARAWLARAHPVGTQLTVHLGNREMISGRFAGLEDDGALRLERTDNGEIEIVRAADVSLS